MLSPRDELVWMDNAQKTWRGCKKGEQGLLGLFHDGEAERH